MDAWVLASAGPTGSHGPCCKQNACMILSAYYMYVPQESPSTGRDCGLCGLIEAFAEAVTTYVKEDKH